MEKAEFSGNI